MDFNNLPENLSKEEIDYVIPKLIKRMKTMLAKIDNKEINGDKNYVKLLSLIRKNY